MKDVLAAFSVSYIYCFFILSVFISILTLTYRASVCNDVKLLRIEYVMPVRPVVCWFTEVEK